VADSYVTVPALNLNTNTVSFAMWIRPNGPQLDYTGFLMTRSGTSAGIGYGGDFSSNRGQLIYTWNNGTTWTFPSGLMIPSDKWSFVAVAIDENNAALYLCYKDESNADVLLSTNNSTVHISEAWGGSARIGGDPNGDGRTFNGIVDEVTVFNRTLSPAEVLDLYRGGGVTPVRLSIERSAPNVILTWPQGVLQEALSVLGPWANNPAASPYSVLPSGAQKVYRVRVSQ